MFEFTLSMAIARARRAGQFGLIGFTALVVASCGDEAGPAQSRDPSTPQQLAETEADGEAGDQEAEREAAKELLKAASFRRLESGAHVLGSPSAPIKMIAYESYSCGACAYFEEFTLPLLYRDYIQAGKVELEIRSFPRHTPDIVATSVLNCSSVERYGALSRLLFATPKEWVKTQDQDQAIQDVASVTKRAGIGERVVRRCVEDDAIKQKITALYSDAIKTYSVTATPTIILDGDITERAHIWETLEPILQGKL